MQTITQVTKEFGISTRTLRYYEQIGLLMSKRVEDYSYRVYDEESLARLRQIVVLRKLRIPLKQISVLLSDANVNRAVNIFNENIAELDGEINSLVTIREILTRFTDELKNKGIRLSDAIFSDESLMSLAPPARQNVKEELSMEELNKASEELLKMKDSDVRIVYLPPMCVASYLASGDECEGKANDEIAKFIKANNLTELKPDLRCFGFDCSKGATGIGVSSHAYEVWVSIPDDVPVPEPLIKKQFIGGLYAAHVLRSWDFQDWRRLAEWVHSNGKYANAYGDPRCLGVEYNPGQGFEETLNYPNFLKNGGDMQLDLLFPIREK